MVFDKTNDAKNRASALQSMSLFHERYSDFERIERAPGPARELTAKYQHKQARRRQYVADTLADRFGLGSQGPASN